MPLIDLATPQNEQSLQFEQRDFSVVSRANRRIPLVLEKAQDCYLYDVGGREILDLTSGWNVANAGWNNPAIVAAIEGQLTKTAFSPPWCSHPGRIQLAERINELMDTPDQSWKCFSCVTGSEAVEIGIRAAKLMTGRKGVIGFDYAYHGHTLGAILAGGITEMIDKSYHPDPYHQKLPMPHPFAEGHHEILQRLEVALSTDPLPAVVLLEAVFTNPGVIYHQEASFYQELVELCHAKGALVMFDEVGTGFYRTGPLFGFQHYDVQPDIISCAKALGSGMIPIATTIMKEEVAEKISGPGFSCTFGWTPVATAAAMANLRFLQDQAVGENAAQMGALYQTELNLLKAKHKVIHEVRGKGLEIGVELRQDGKAVSRDHLNQIVIQMLGEGVFLEPGSAFCSTLLIMPPLIINEAQVRKSVNALDHVLKRVFND